MLFSWEGVVLIWGPPIENFAPGPQNCLGGPAYAEEFVQCMHHCMETGKKIAHES